MLPPRVAAAANRYGVNPTALAGADPELIHVLANAIGTGDPQRIAAVTGAINALQKPQGAGDWKVISDGRGGFIRYNERSGDVEQSQQSAGTMMGDLILKPGDPRRAQFSGIPDDNKTYRVRPTDQGRIQIEPLDERESKVADHIIAVSNSLEGNQTFKDFRSMHQAVESLDASFSQGNSAGDLNGLVQVFKAIDPNSTVTKGEGDTIVASGGNNAFLQYWANKLNISNGTMTPQMRAEFMNAARDQLKARSGQALEFYEGKRRQAETIGLKKEEIEAATNGYKPPNFSKPRAKEDTFPERDTEGRPTGPG